MMDEENREAAGEVDVAASRSQEEPDPQMPGEDAGTGAPQADAADRQDSGVDEPDGAGQPELSEPAGEAPRAGPSEAPQADRDDAMLEMLQNLPKDHTPASPDEIEFDQTRVGNAEFQQLKEPTAPPQPTNIELLMDINLPVSIELGRTKMSIAEILAIGPGAVVELNKLAGEPVDVLVNQKLVAKGEVVVIDENFGVRITQLMTPEERLKLLGEEQ